VKVGEMWDVIIKTVCNGFIGSQLTKKE